MIPPRLPRKHVVWMLLLLLPVATVLWVLNTVNIIQGSWANVFNAVFTGIGAILALLQWLAQKPTGEVPSLATPSSPTTHEEAWLDLHLLTARTKKRTGAVLVYTNRGWRGISLYLVPGLLDTAAPIEAASNTIEHRVAGRRLFLCCFPAVPPGHYTLVAPSKHRSVSITVHAGHVAEIDWRT